RGAGIRSRDVLGRAIAHEIGHLLLNTNSHPEAGLMRAAWSRSELRRNATDDWRFREEDAKKIREWIARRSTARYQNSGCGGCAPAAPFAPRAPYNFLISTFLNFISP